MTIPESGLVIATGYREDALRRRFKNDDRISFLGKPLWPNSFGPRWRP